MLYAKTSRIFSFKILHCIIKCSFIVICLHLFLNCKGGDINKTLVEDVASLNSKCPISAGKIGILNHADIEDNCVVLHYYLSEEFKQMAWNKPEAVFDERLQYLEIAMLDTANIHNEPLTRLYFDAFKNGFSIKNQYNFKFDNGIDADVAKTVLKPNIFFSKYLNGNMKELCEEALKIRRHNENIIYSSLNLPDSLKSFDTIEDSMFVLGAYVPSKQFVNVWFNQFDLRKNILKAFKDPSMKTFAKQCIICEKGICFRYLCLVENDSISVNFSQNELKSLLTDYDKVVNTYNVIEQLK